MEAQGVGADISQVNFGDIEKPSEAPQNVREIDKTAAKAIPREHPRGPFKNIRERFKKRPGSKRDVHLHLKEKDRSLPKKLSEIQKKIEITSKKHSLDAIPELSAICIDVMRLKLMSENTELIKEFIDANREAILSQTTPGIFVAEFFLLYPKEVGQELTNFRATHLSELPLSELSVWNEIAFFELNLSFGQIVGKRVDEIFNLHIDDKLSSEKMKPKAFSHFAEWLRSAKDDTANGQNMILMANFFDDLGRICKILCNDVLFKRNFELKFQELPSKISNMGFAQKPPGDITTKEWESASWTKILAQQSISTLITEPEKFDNYVQKFHTEARKIYAFSTAKMLDDERYTYSGDAYKSFYFANGVTVHVVVDSAGSQRNAYMAALSTIQKVSFYLKENGVPACRSSEITNYFSKLVRDLMALTSEKGYECTFTFNVVYPGQNGNRLLVGVSIGDTWVFKRERTSNGEFQIQEITLPVEKSMTENQGALGNTVLSTQGIADVYVELVRPGTELFFSSDAMRDEWKTIKNILSLEHADILRAIVAPFIESQRLVNRLTELAAEQHKIRLEFKKISDEYAVMREKVMRYLNCKEGLAETKFDELYQSREKDKFCVKIGLTDHDSTLLDQYLPIKKASEKAERLHWRIENLINRMRGGVTENDIEILRYLNISPAPQQLEGLNKLLSIKRDDITIVMES